MPRNIRGLTYLLGPRRDLRKVTDVAAADPGEPGGMDASGPEGMPKVAARTDQRIVTVIVDGRNPPTGQVLTPDRDPVGFVGWLGLLCVLADAVSSEDG